MPSILKKDFSLVNFDHIDKKTSICFFDDHQNALQRLQQMKWKGFSKAMFDDNYPSKRGDCYSLKKIFEDVGFSQNQTLEFNLKFFLKNIIQRIAKCKNISDIEPNSTHRLELLKNLSLYYEFPPLFKENYNRWGDKWDDDGYSTKEPLFDSNVFHFLPDEAIYYNWMCLVELS